MATFVQATYALVTFVHISNISDVTGPILTKLFGPNFLGFINFVGQNVLGPNFFRPKFFLDPKFFFRTKIFLGPNIFGTAILLDTTNFFNPKLFWTQNYFQHKIFSDSTFFFRPKIFFEIFFRTQNLLGQKFSEAFSSWKL